MFYRPHLDDHGLNGDPFKALVAPRPIAWVSSVDSAGAVNLAPFSYFNAVADAPPILMIAPYGRKLNEPTEKDTPRNILETGEFVVSMTPYALREAMNRTSAPFAADVDEFEAAGLTPAPSELVKPPRVSESPVAFECRFLQRLELPSRDEEFRNGVIFGEVIGIHIDEGVIVDGRVDVGRYKPVARLGYSEYTVVEHVFSMRRPSAG